MLKTICALNATSIVLFSAVALLGFAPLDPAPIWGQESSTGEVEPRGLPSQPQLGIPTQPSLKVPGTIQSGMKVPHLGASCQPVEVMTGKDRVQIKCRTPLRAPAGVQFFAVGVDDPAFASRVMKLSATAQITDSQVQIVFDPADTSGDRIGCQAATCRLILSIALVEN